MEAREELAKAERSAQLEVLAENNVAGVDLGDLTDVKARRTPSFRRHSCGESCSPLDQL